MKLLALAVLVAIMQTAPQVPPKTPDASADSATTKEATVACKCAPLPQPGKDWWYRAYVILTGALVVIGAVGVGYAIKTLKAIERQAKANEGQLTEIQQSVEKTDRMIVIAAQEAENGRAAMEAAKQSADAAVLNAQAIINSERPWLFINIVTFPANADEHGIPEHLGFSVTFRNHGKTPAEIVGFDQHPDCCKDTDDLPFPPKYSLEGHVMLHTRMVPPAETWRDPGESSLWPEQFLLSDDWNDIRVSRKRFIYWGRLQYRDLIEDSKTIHELAKVGTIHETCFCYFWSPRKNEFLICGPLGYNKHT